MQWPLCYVHKVGPVNTVSWRKGDHKALSLHEDLFAVSDVTFFARGVVTDEVPVLLQATLNSLRKKGREGGRQGKEIRKMD